MTNPIFLAGGDPDALVPSGDGGPRVTHRLCAQPFLAVSFLCLCLRTIMAPSPALPRAPLAQSLFEGD